MSPASSIIQRVHNIINKIPYHDDGGNGGVHPVNLITIDQHGFPSSRLVVPRKISEDLSEIQLKTRHDTRKVVELKLAKNDKVALSWWDQRGRQGWVNIKGVATLHETDAADKDQEYRSVDIIVKCSVLEVMDYNENLMCDSEGYKPVILEWSSSHKEWKDAKTAFDKKQSDTE